MDAAVDDVGRTGHDKAHEVAVAVITPVGTFPDDDDFRRAGESTMVRVVLEEAARHFKITNTTDWVAHANGRTIDPDRSFAANGLRGIVEIEWHKHEGGGGA